MQLGSNDLNGLIYTKNIAILFLFASAWSFRNPPRRGTPRAPAQIEISDLTPRKVTVIWQHSLDDGNSPITAYIVTIKPKDYLLWQDGQVNEVSSNTNRITIKDLQPNSAYQVRVTARNAIGLSPPSSSSEIITPAESTPCAPSDIEILGLTSRNVTVRWQHSLGDGNSPITAYIVTIKSEGFFSDDGQIYEVSSNTSYIVIKNLRPNTAYQVRVSARNAAGYSPPSSPSEVFFTLSERPTSAPLQLAARNVESDIIEISWRAPPPDTIRGVLQGYDIQYGILEENVSTTIIVDGTKESVVIHGLKPFTKYRIAVRALNEAGRGPAAFTYVNTKEERTIDHKTTSINQDQDMQTTGVIDHTTRSVNHEKGTESTDSSFIRYVLYIIPLIGFILGVGLCLWKKFKCCSCVGGTSNTNLHSDSGINSEDENLQLHHSSQHYWTVVTNARGDVFTALEMDTGIELDENISRSHHNRMELEAYIHPVHSDSVELDQSCSVSVEHSGYIDPISSGPVKNYLSIGPVPSEPVEHDGNVNSIHSEPVEHDGYIDPIP